MSVGRGQLWSSGFRRPQGEIQPRSIYKILYCLVPKPIRAIRHPKSIHVKNETEFYKINWCRSVFESFADIATVSLENFGAQEVSQAPDSSCKIKARQGGSSGVEKNVCRFEELARARNAAF